MPTATTEETIALSLTQVAVHPLVLLSVADNYNRSAAGTKRRVVGVLLGQNNGKTVNVANSFAVPFEEDDKDPSVWFLDHNFVENMYDMYKKINAKEKMIGWYHSGPKLRPSDLQINELFKRWIPQPVLVVVDVEPTVGIPTDAYFAVEEIKDDGSSTSKTFVHVSSTIEAEEAEEIAVEHLLRDIRDQSTGTLSTKITNQMQSLQGLNQRLAEIAAYLESVVQEKLPINHTILGALQDIFNLLPNLTPATTADGQPKETELSRSFRTNMHDNMMTVYLSSLVRSVMSLHDLIDNRKAPEPIASKASTDADKEKSKEDKEKSTTTTTINDEDKKKEQDEGKKDEKVPDEDKMEE